MRMFYQLKETMSHVNSKTEERMRAKNGKMQAEIKNIAGYINKKITPCI